LTLKEKRAKKAEKKKSWRAAWALGVPNRACFRAQ
jgi:hypothetical protein